MWKYEKRLQYPVKISQPNPDLALYIISQYGGPDGEMGASMRYLSQRFAMPYKIAKGTLTDIGTEELGHLEIVGAIVHQLTRNLTPEEIERSGFGPYYIDHTVGVWPQAAGGVPFNACEFQSKGDPITDLFEDLAAEQKARVTYDNILRMVKDPEVCDPIRFLRKREIVHFQRFGEVLRDVQDHLNSKNFYAFNPSFDIPQGPRCDQIQGAQNGQSGQDSQSSQWTQAGQGTAGQGAQDGQAAQGSQNDQWMQGGQSCQWAQNSQDTQWAQNSQDTQWAQNSQDTQWAQNGQDTQWAQNGQDTQWTQADQGAGTGDAGARTCPCRDRSSYFQS